VGPTDGFGVRTPGEAECLALLDVDVGSQIVTAHLSECAPERGVDLEELILGELRGPAALGAVVRIVHAAVDAAGLTPGGFYKHFASKAGLLAAALERAASTAVRRRNEGLEHLLGEQWLRSFVASYLSVEHALDVAEGCPVTALAPELAKGSAEERRALDAAVATTVAAIAGQLGGSKADQRRAWGVLASCVGTLSLARSVQDPEVARRLLEAGRARAVSAGVDARPRRPSVRGRSSTRSRTARGSRTSAR
jgi:TetR/AcrR family transcriptional repressor of nem operon